MGNKPLKNALIQGINFFEENKKIIINVSKVYSYNDEPKLYQYVCSFRDKRSRSSSVASGAAFDKEKALIKLFGETMERYALSSNDEKTILQTYNELIKKEKNALNPQKSIIFTNKKIYRSRILDEKIHWVKGRSLKNNTEIYIPAQLVYVPYIHYKKEPLIQLPLSTGAAAGASLNDALLRGIFEIIERDSFMIHYLNRLNSHKINLKKIKNPSICRFLDMMKMYNLELVCMDLTTDLEINSIAALVIDHTGIGPSVSLGLKAGVNFLQNLVGAIEEALMVRSWVRDDYGHLKPVLIKKNEITTVEKRAQFWFPLQTINHLSFWTKSTNTIKPKSIKDNKSIDFKSILNSLYDKNLDIYYVDITTKEVEKCGFKVVKVIIPKLQPLYLNERYPYLYSDRLYEAPLIMGVLRKKKNIKELNNIPHPFL